MWRKKERFNSFISVLGSKGFDSGTRSWDIEDVHSPAWVLDVTAESVQRQRGITIQSGLWSLLFYKDEYTACLLPGPNTVLSEETPEDRSSFGLEQRKTVIF